MKRPDARNSERGATAIVLAASILAVAGFSSLAVDVAVMYVRKQAHVNVADGAAISGAYAYLVSTSTGGTYTDSPPTGKFADASSAATSVAQKNGISDPMTVTVTFPTSNEIQVHTTEDKSLLFARVLGWTTSRIGATAIARFGAPNSVKNGLRPWGVDSTFMSTVTYGTDTTLKVSNISASGNITSAGNFLPIDLNNGTGASVYRTNEETGSTSTISVGSTLQTETGNMKGPTDQGVTSDTTSILNQGAVAPYSTQVWGSTTNPVTITNPRVVLLPILDWSGLGSGKQSFTVLGFAAFYVESQPASGQVMGKFLNFADSPAAYFDSGVPGAGDYHLETVKLIG